MFRRHSETRDSVRLRGFFVFRRFRAAAMTAEVTSGTMTVNQTRLGNAGAITDAALRETLSDIAQENDND